MTQLMKVLVGATLLFACVSTSFAATDKGCDSFLNPSAANNPDKAVRRTAFASIQAFKNYITALQGRLLEREYLLDIASLSLLSEEHLLLMGPPGNAKSMFADDILGNMTDAAGAKSYFRLQMTPETTLSETHGPLDFKALNETGRYVRLLEEGMLHSRNVFIDEIFDARANAQRNILGMLNERAHAQGVHITPGQIETAFAATNKYISEVYEKAGDDSPKAVLDRFAFSAFVPGEFALTDSYVKLIQGAKKGSAEIPALAFDDMENLRGLVKQVTIPDGVAKFLALLSTRMKEETEALEQSSIKNYKERLKNGEEPGIPYRSTKYHSPRTLGKAAGVLKSIVVLDWIKKGGKRRLEANLDDIHSLMTFFTLNGPSNDFINSIVERTSNPHERAQLMAIIQEREIFEKYYASILDEVNQVLIHFALHDLQAESEVAKTEKEREALGKKILSLMISLDNEIDPHALHADKSGKDIGIDLIREQYKKMLIDVLGGEGKAGSLLDRMESERQAMIAERQREEAKRREEELKAQRLEAARLASIKAKEDAEKRAVEEVRAKMVAALDNKKVIFDEDLNFSDISLIKYAYHEESQTLAVIQVGGNRLTLIHLNEHGGKIKGNSVGINFATILNNETPSKITFVDKDHLLFESDEGMTAVNYNFTLGESEEILLSRTNTKSVFDSKNKIIYTVDGLGILGKGSLGGSRTKKELKFKDSAIESAFHTIKSRNIVGALDISADGQFLTMTSEYRSDMFVIDIEQNMVISTKKLFESDSSFDTGPGHLGYVDSNYVVADRSSNIVDYKVIADKTNGAAESNYGIHWMSSEAGVALIGATGGLSLWNTKTDEIVPINAEGVNFRSHVGAPFVLPDGRLVVVAHTGSWHLVVLK